MSGVVLPPCRFVTSDILTHAWDSFEPDVWFLFSFFPDWTGSTLSLSSYQRSQITIMALHSSKPISLLFCKVQNLTQQSRWVSAVWAERKNHLPWPAGNAVPNAGQEVNFGQLCGKGALLARVQFVTHTKILLWRAAFKSISPQCLVVHRVIHPQLPRTSCCRTPWGSHLPSSPVSLLRSLWTAERPPDLAANPPSFASSEHLLRVNSAPVSSHY